MNQNSSARRLGLTGFAFLLTTCFLAAAEPRVLMETTFGMHFDEVTKFEGASGLLHEGWEDNSVWAKAKVRYEPERLTEEVSAQRVIVEDPGTGIPAIRSLSNFKIETGKYYEILVSMRAEKSQKVGVSLRNYKAPYKPITVRKDFTIGAEWKTWRFTAKAVEATEARLFIVFYERGSVSINHLSLRVWDTPPLNAVSVRNGNLLRNGDFRLGRFDWCAFGETARDPERFPRETLMRYSVDPPTLTEESAGGLGLSLQEETLSVLVSSMVPASGRRSFKASARVRRSVGEGPVLLRLFAFNWNKAPSLEKSVGTEWETLNLEGEFPEQENFTVRAELRAAGAGRLLVGEVTIQQDPGGNQAPAFGLFPLKALPLYPIGTPVEVSLRHAGATGSNVSWTLVDSQGRVLKSGRWTLRSPIQSVRFEGALNTAAAIEPTITITDGGPIACGWYQIRWTAPWALDTQGRASFGIVPPLGRCAGDASPFGIHVEGGELGVEKMRLMGFQWLRCNNPLFTKWTAVEPRKGLWQYPDLYVDRFVKAGLSILGSLDRTPLWNARNPTNNAQTTDYWGYKADLPADLDAWHLYASNMAVRYRDKIRYWDIWNEPDIPFLRPPLGMTHDKAYRRLLEEAASALHSVDPELKIVGGPAYFFYKRYSYEGSQEDFTDCLIDNGGLSLLDVFGFHYYIKEKRLLDASDVPQMRLDAIRVGFAKAGKPTVIWDTEGGFNGFTKSALDLDLPSTSVSIDEAADELVWWFASQLGQGVEKLFWYDGFDNFFYRSHITKNLFDYREPRPAAVAAAILTQLLDGRYTVESLTLEGGRRLRFSGPSGAVTLAWALPGKIARLRPASDERCFDTLARPVATSEGVLVLGEKPVYLIGEKDVRLITGVPR